MNVPLIVTSGRATAILSINNYWRTAILFELFHEPNTGNSGGYAYLSKRRFEAVTPDADVIIAKCQCVTTCAEASPT